MNDQHKDTQSTSRVWEKTLIPVTRDFKLVPAGVEGETVIVTAPVQGQNAAIDQLLSSMPVMNDVRRGFPGGT